MRINTIILFISLMILFLAGCSGSASNPVTPFDDSQNISAIPDYADTTDSQNQILGYWTINIDTESLEAIIEPDRSMQAHYNLKGLIPTPVIHVNSFDSVTRILDVDISVYNPYFLAAYDLRGILFDTGFGYRLENADGWTSLFDPAAGGPVNQFKAYATNQPNRVFGPLSTHVVNYQLYMPVTGGPISYAIEGSYPGNCAEPYMIKNFDQGRGLNQETGSSCHLTIDVYDWQADVSQVFIDAPGITGEAHTQFASESSTTWGCTLSNNTGVASGVYTCLISAKSTGAPNLGQYTYADIEVSEYHGADWTFFVYMHESNLTTFAYEDLNEMEVAGSVEGEFNIVVLFDRTAESPDLILNIAHDPDGYNGTLVSPTVDDGGAVIPPSGDVDMGDGQTLEKFLRWGVANFPAEHYGLDLWDHGDGPFSAVPQPAFIRSCCNGLQIWEIRDAVNSILTENPSIGRFDFIGFDACLMAWIETGYCLRNVTEVCLGSEMLEPGAGWAYADPMNYLKNNVGSSTAEGLASEIVDSYLASSGDGDTLGAWRSDDLINIVTPCVNTFATELTNALGAHRSTISSCLSDSGYWGAYCYEYDVTDFGYFAELIKNKTSLPTSLRNSATNLINAIESAMVTHGVNGSGTGCPYSESGWQVWFPEYYSSSDNAQRRADYINLEFSGTLWDEFLAAYE
jgi:hypothetical protein